GSDRPSAQGGAPRPSRAATCPASAARKTSHFSSPVVAGSASSSCVRVSTGSQRYSSRNSATSRQRSDSSAPVIHRPSCARLIGWYGPPPPPPTPPPPSRPRPPPPHAPPASGGSHPLRAT